MQRIPHAQTPPIHHPVPHRPVQVPHMQSPPPPSQSSDPYDNPYGAPSYMPGVAAGPYANQFNSFASSAGSFFGDPMTAQMGFNVARAAMAGGSDVAEKKISGYLSSLKPFFAVTNSYVVQKLYILLNPWRHHPWSRQTTARASAAHPGSSEIMFLPPREDTNAPDMYLPVMSFITYILLSVLTYGLSGSFHPEQLGYTATTALSAVVFELLGLKLGCYLLNISNSQLLDLVAYSGYKFLGCTISILSTSVLGNGWLNWGVFGYLYMANAFFLLRSLKYVLLPDSDGAGPETNVYSTAPRQQRKRRTWFLFGYSYVVQLVFMLLLTKGIGGTVKA